MKLNIITKRILSGIAICVTCFAGLTACNDFLDVRPKSQIPHNLHFSSESGFFDQLTGVYTKMCEPSMYGTEMSFGFVEVLGQNYSIETNLNSVYYNISQYDYENAAVKGKITSMWTNTYNCIANLNVILKYIDDDRSIFSGNNYYIFKGEALALRAFLHFDMLRLFAPSYASNPNAPAIPYVTEYEPAITKQYTVTDAIDLTVKDLLEALELLENDPINSATFRYEYRSRKYYFNYWAAKILLARVYLYKGDISNALEHSEEVVQECENSGNTPLYWVSQTAAESPYTYDRDIIYVDELAFRLNINDMKSIADRHFNSQSQPPNVLSPDDNKINQIYELENGLGDDYRHVYCYTYDGAGRYLSKFWQYGNGRHDKTFPIIRKSEAYYIAAETMKNIDSETAVERLNMVRNHRKLSSLPLSTDLTPAQIQQEIFKEYRKEFMGEGQLFYYYKRLNLSTIEGAGVTANNNVYVLPMPDNEIEYGNRD